MLWEDGGAGILCGPDPRRRQKNLIYSLYCVVVGGSLFKFKLGKGSSPKDSGQIVLAKAYGRQPSFDIPALAKNIGLRLPDGSQE